MSLSNWVGPKNLNMRVVFTPCFSSPEQLKIAYQKVRVGDAVDQWSALSPHNEMELCSTSGLDWRPFSVEFVISLSRV